MSEDERIVLTLDAGGTHLVFSAIAGFNEAVPPLVLTARGDDRSSRPLTALASRKGCGFLGLGDCFSCLRRGTDLADAQKAAQQRKSPEF